MMTYVTSLCPPPPQGGYECIQEISEDFLTLVRRYQVRFHERVKCPFESGEEARLHLSQPPAGGDGDSPTSLALHSFLFTVY